MTPRTLALFFLCLPAAILTAACTAAPPELNQQLADAVSAWADLGVAVKAATEAALAAPTPENVGALAELVAQQVALSKDVLTLRESVASYGGGVDWAQVGVAAASILGALTGVRIMRGPAKPIPKDDVNTLRTMIADADVDRRRG